MPQQETIDLLVVGAGPTGIAIGAEAVEHGLSVLLVDKGQLTQAILDFPTYMNFFTTRDKLEIADIPLTIPAEKPTRQDALVYYRAVAEHYKLPLALHEEVLSAKHEAGIFTVNTLKDGKYHQRRARAMAIATGYFDHPFKLAVPGAELPWVHTYYRDPYQHFKEEVVIIGGGNSACEVALELWRNGTKKVTMIVRGAGFKPGIKYWVKPDIENRIQEGAVFAQFESTVTEFGNEPRSVRVRHKTGRETVLPTDAAYALIGFHPDADLLFHCGVKVDPVTLVPQYNPETCESNVPHLYIGGTVQAGLATDRIFIENSREHGPRIVAHLKRTLSN